MNKYIEILFAIFLTMLTIIAIVFALRLLVIGIPIP